VSTAADPARARAVLREALIIVEALERAGKLTAEKKDWPKIVRDLLAKLPPERVRTR
jgi:hypothetical protein